MVLSGRKAADRIRLTALPRLFSAPAAGAGGKEKGRGYLPRPETAPGGPTQTFARLPIN